MTSSAGRIGYTLSEFPKTASKEKPLTSSERKTQEASKRIFTGAKVVKAAVFVAIALGVLFLASNPVGWMIAATAVSAFALAMFFQVMKDQKTAFIISAYLRSKKPNESHYNQINMFKDIPSDSMAKLYLGALPNKKTQFGEHLKGIGVGAVISVNEPWERSEMAVSKPYSYENWQSLDIQYGEIDALDHHLVGFDALNEIADMIHAHLSENRNVYIHCRAGVGRSAMGVAAYLIKYQNMTPQEAADCIKKSRPSSTIQNKLKDKKGEEGLNSYHTMLTAVRASYGLDAVFDPNKDYDGDYVLGKEDPEADHQPLVTVNQNFERTKFLTSAAQTSLLFG